MENTTPKPHPETPKFLAEKESPLGKAIIARLKNDHAEAIAKRGQALRNGTPVDEGLLFSTRDAMSVVGGYYNNPQATDVYVARGGSVENLGDYLGLVLDERLGALEGAESELAADPKDPELIEWRAEMALKAGSIKRLMKIYADIRREGATVHLDTANNDSTESWDWDLSGDEGLTVQLKVLERLRNEGDGVKLVLAGLGNVDDTPLAEGKSPEELRDQMRYIEYIKDVLLRFSPESGQSVHEWYEQEQNTLLAALEALNGDQNSEAEAAVLTDKLSALDRAYSLLVEMTPSNNVNSTD
ncbi:hypothetical protein EOL96_07585 [Candidatus Saccharibacteria bacterium]|nr:hypothetical protein [Candidatus Saccharibacteria bacterium]